MKAKYKFQYDINSILSDLIYSRVLEPTSKRSSFKVASEFDQEDGLKKYGKSKKHRPNPIIQMGLFMDGDGIPLAFSVFPGNANEQTSLKPLEKKILSEFGCQKFIYCSDAGLGSEDIREYNHMGQRSFIVTQSIKKLKAEEKTWALNQKGVKRVSDDKPVDM